MTKINKMTKKQLEAALATLQAEKAALTDSAPLSPDTDFGGIVLRDNVVNTEKYGIPYTFTHFVDSKGEKLTQVRGNEAAESALALVKGIVYGSQSKGGARWNKGAKAHSLLDGEITPAIRALVFKGKSKIKGNYTA